jgi:hypothetical protein
MNPVLEQGVDPDLGGGDLAGGEQRGKLAGQAALVELAAQPAQGLE